MKQNFGFFKKVTSFLALGVCVAPLFAQEAEPADFSPEQSEFAAPGTPNYDFEKDLQKAQAGDPAAQYRLYFYCATVLNNPEEAFVWLLKSANGGCAPAQGTLGGLYVQGGFAGIEQSPEKAFFWWEKAAEQGIAPAQASLALFLLSGVEGVCEADPARAAELMKDAATAGFAPAQFWLGKEYLRGGVLEKNEILGVIFLRSAAEQNDADAQGFLASYYYTNGNAEEAVSWAEKASLRGSAYGDFVLGCLLIEGKAVPADIEGGLLRITKAAEQGLWFARSFLVDAYFGGFGGIRKNRAQGTHWLELAVEPAPGEEFDPKKLAYFRALYGVLCKDSGKIAESIKWLNAAAEAGSVIGQYELARIYYYGRGVPADKAKAVRFFRLAAEQGHAASQFNLAVCLINGEGVPVNRAEALEWAKKAAEKGLVPAQKMLENEAKKERKD